MTELSLSKICETLNPKVEAHPFYGKKKTNYDRAMGRGDHMLSNFYSADVGFGYVVPSEIWNIPEELPMHELVKRRDPVWCYCAEKGYYVVQGSSNGRCGHVLLDQRDRLSGASKETWKSN